MATILTVLAFVTLACSIGGLTLGDHSATVEFKLTEERLNEMVANIDSVNNSDPDNLLDKITNIELHDGYIRFFGEDTLLDGSQVSGNFDISLTAVDGNLVVALIAVDIPGVDMNDPRITKVNTELSKDFSDIVAESQGDVVFKEAKVEEDLLTFTIQVGFN